MKYPRLLRRIALAAATIAATAAIAESHYMKYVQWGDEAVANGKYSDAIECYREAMKAEPSNPQNVMLLSNVGMIQHYQGEDSLALRTLTDARAIAPGSVVILHNRAKILESLGRPYDAILDLAKALEMDSTYAPAYYERAAINMGLGNWKQVEADGRRYAELKPADPQGKLLMAVIFTNSGRPADAIPLYGELIEKKPEAVYYAARSMCYLATDQLAEASDDIARGLELDPDDGELYYNRAVLNRMRYREEDARADAMRARELGVSDQRIAAFLSAK